MISLFILKGRPTIWYSFGKKEKSICEINIHITLNQRKTFLDSTWLKSHLPQTKNLIKEGNVRLALSTLSAKLS